MTTVIEALKMISSAAASSIKLDAWLIGEFAVVIGNYINAGRTFENMRNL